ncbi:c-type cytochrome [Pontibacter virosus]|uniref:Cytochrome c n=1 Tax=Pontibacter virosus TaxID=1765052 RepID=A0A2U1ANH2_9BACT|nr:c-type cytochrome [Pontibacter virosus]PVY37935.1 cytochrome c [Pontibacter virosus]
MKKILMAISAFALLSACGNEQKSEYERYYDSDYQPDTTAVASRPQPPRPATTPPAGGATQDVQTTPAGTPTGPGTSEAAGQPKEALAGQYAKGEKLIAGSDCLACHKVDQKVVGPSYEEVAQKYEFNDKNLDYLAGKIIKGGAGVWGQIPMPPHPNMSETDAKEMSRYILSLRK